MRVSIGIDLGSSRVKLLALDESGECQGVTMASYATDSRHAGYAEQNPDRWWDALRLAMSELLSRPALRGGTVVALGLTGQMHGAVFLDEAGAPLRHALMWSDARAEAETEEIERLIPREQLVAVTGNRSNVSFTAPKIMWVRDHEPQILERTRWIVQPKDALRARLTGDRRRGRFRRLGHAALRSARAALVRRDLLTPGDRPGTAWLHCPNPRPWPASSARMRPEPSACRPGSRSRSAEPTLRRRHSAWDWRAKKTPPGRF